MRHSPPASAGSRSPPPAAPPAAAAPCCGRRPTRRARSCCPRSCATATRSAHVNGQKHCQEHTITPTKASRLRRVQRTLLLPTRDSPASPPVVRRERAQAAVAAAAASAPTAARPAGPRRRQQPQHPPARAAAAAAHAHQPAAAAPPAAQHLGRQQHQPRGALLWPPWGAPPAALLPCAVPALLHIPVAPTVLLDPLHLLSIITTVIGIMYARCRPERRAAISHAVALLPSQPAGAPRPRVDTLWRRRPHRALHARNTGVARGQLRQAPARERYVGVTARRCVGAAGGRVVGGQQGGRRRGARAQGRAPWLAEGAQLWNGQQQAGGEGGGGGAWGAGGGAGPRARLAPEVLDLGAQPGVQDEVGGKELC